MYTRERVNSKDYFVPRYTSELHSWGWGKCERRERSHSNTNSVQHGTPAIPISVDITLSSNVPKTCVLFAYWLAKTGKTDSDKTDGRTVSYIMNLCSATMPNIELFCFIPIVRIWLLPGLIAGARQQQLFWFQHAWKQGQQEISQLNKILCCMFLFMFFHFSSETVNWHSNI